MAVVSNGSRRPITNVRCSLGDESDEDVFPKMYSLLAVIAGQLGTDNTPGLDSPHLADLVPRTRVLRILYGEEYGFIFELTRIILWPSPASRSASPMTPACVGRSTVISTLRHCRTANDQSSNSVTPGRRTGHYAWTQNLTGIVRALLTYRPPMRPRACQAAAPAGNPVPNPGHAVRSGA